VIENAATDPGQKDARDRTVSPGRLAAFWSVHPNTVYRDIRKGALKAYRLPGGQLRVRMSDARRYGRPVE
jgi:predicted site-specific integrase-resolvase